MVFKTELDKAKYELEDPKGKVKTLEGILVVKQTELDKAKYELEDPKGKVKILEGNLKIEKDGNAPNVKKIDDLKKEMDKLKEKHFKERLTKADAKEVVQWKKDYTGQILGKAKGFYDEAAKKLNEFITGENKKW